MSYYRREIRFGFGDGLTPAVKVLLILNVAVFVLQILFDPYVVRFFALSAPLVLPWNFQIWRLGTYMFLHGDFWHLFWNMFALFMFGGSIEMQWGSRSFYRYYLLCGLGGALLALVPFAPFWAVPIVGASGAIYGVLVAFAVLFPYRQILVFFVIPVQARWLVLFFALFTFVSALGGSEGVAHVVHLGGLVTGYGLMRWVGITGGSRRRPLDREFMGSVTDAYRRWRMKRLRKKFEEYYEKRTGGGPGQIH